MVDFTTAIGKVRLLVSDLGEPPLIGDDILAGYLGLHGWDLDAYTADSSNAGEHTDRMLWRAAADVLDAMATSEVLLAKKIRTQDLSTDGPAVAADLRKQAAVLRGKADAADAADDEGFFEIIPFYPGCKPEGAEHRL